MQGVRRPVMEGRPCPFVRTLEAGILQDRGRRVRALPNAVLGPCGQDRSRNAEEEQDGYRKHQLMQPAHGRLSSQGHRVFLHHHNASLRSRRALAITDTELKVMAAAASIGLSNSPKTG